MNNPTLLAETESITPTNSRLFILSKMAKNPFFERVSRQSLIECDEDVDPKEHPESLSAKAKEELEQIEHFQWSGQMIRLSNQRKLKGMTNVGYYDYCPPDCQQNCVYCYEVLGRIVGFE